MPLLVCVINSIVYIDYQLHTYFKSFKYDKFTNIDLAPRILDLGPKSVRLAPNETFWLAEPWTSRYCWIVYLTKLTVSVHDWAIHVLVCARGLSPRWGCLDSPKASVFLHLSRPQGLSGFAALILIQSGARTTGRFLSMLSLRSRGACNCRTVFIPLEMEYNSLQII